jgi:hypothetical protein
MDGWQFTSKYSLKAISSGVDMSYFYTDFTTMSSSSQSAAASSENKTDEKVEAKVTEKTETKTTKTKSEYQTGNIYTL